MSGEELVGIGGWRVEHFTPHVLASRSFYSSQLCTDASRQHLACCTARVLLSAQLLCHCVREASRSPAHHKGATTASPCGTALHQRSNTPPRPPADRFPVHPAHFLRKPQQNRAPVARGRLSSSPDWGELVPRHLSHRTDLFSDQLTCGI